MTGRSPKYPPPRAVAVAPLELATAPDDDEQTDDWKLGWRACREILGEEWAVWYARGVAARPVERGARLDVLLSATAAFIVGLVIAAILLA